MVLFLLVGCSSNVFKKKFIQPLCLSGNGKIIVDLSGQKNYFMIESLSKKNIWLIGVQFPLAGEKIIEISDDLSEQRFGEFSQLVSAGHPIDFLKVRQIFELINQFHLLSRENKFPVDGISKNEFSLIVNKNEDTGGNKRVKNYWLEIYHQGLIFKTKVLNIVLNYTECAESLSF